MIFRDGAKTTTCRLFATKRIAYGISHTILFIGKGESSALRSLGWIKKQVMYNRLWADTFRLRPGDKWAPDSGELEIFHGTDEYPIRLLAMGITGQTRGINIDDYRPDLIIVDDPCDEENTATKEQRQKISELFFGALYNSLAPRSESPDAKMVLLQTLLNENDLISQCQKDPTFKTLVFSIFDNDNKSRWEIRHPTKELQLKKEGYIQRNQLSMWLREYECVLSTPETSLFRGEWLQYYDIEPDGMVTFMAIDPVPPATDAQRQRDTLMADRDYEVISVIGVWRGKYYLLEYSMMRGHEPDWTVTEFFRLLDKWKPMRVRVETVAYQSTLKWLLEQAMRARKRFVQINGNNARGVSADRRKKEYRIADALNGIASNKMLFVKKEHTDFIEQFTRYPRINHDDVLEATCEAINEARAGGVILDGQFDTIDDKIEPLNESWKLIA
jgi:transcription termination factor NusB